MNFNELTRVMLHSMDFFELRRTAARYGVPYQGVRRNKLIRDVERKIAIKNNPGRFAQLTAAPLSGSMLLTSEAAVAARETRKQRAVGDPSLAPRINTYSSRNMFSKLYAK